MKNSSIFYAIQGIWTLVAIFGMIMQGGFSCKINTHCNCFGQSFCCCGSDEKCYEDPIDMKNKCQNSIDCNVNADCPQDQKEMVCEYGVCNTVKRLNLIPILIFFAFVIIASLICCVIFTQVKKNNREQEMISKPEQPSTEFAKISQ